MPSGVRQVQAMADTFFSGPRSPPSHLDCKLIGTLIIYCGWIVLLSVFKPVYISSALQSYCYIVSHLHVQQQRASQSRTRLELSCRDGMLSISWEAADCRAVAEQRKAPCSAARALRTSFILRFRRMRWSWLRLRMVPPKEALAGMTL